MAAIFYVSSLSNPSIPSGTDKPLHWLAYAGLAVFVVRALAGGLPRRIGTGIIASAMLITTGYGVTDEVHQLFVDGRSAEVYDLMADAAGALAGTVACYAWGIISTSSRDDL
jgi:VanZ family protein